MKDFIIMKTTENWFDVRDENGQTHGLFQNRNAAEKWIENIETNERRLYKELAIALNGGGTDD